MGDFMYAYCRKRKKSGYGLTIINKVNQALPTLSTGTGYCVASTRIGTSNKSVVLYTSGSSLIAAIATLSNGVITVGTPTTVGLGTSGSVGMLTSGGGIMYGVIFCGGSLYSFSTNGVGIGVYTPGIDARFGMTTGVIPAYAQTLDILSSTSFLITYNINGGSTGNYIFVVKCSITNPISTATITKTGSLSFYDTGFIAGSSYQGFTKFTSTTGILSWGITNFGRCCVVDFSGANPTKGAYATIGASGTIVRGIQAGQVGKLNDTTGVVPVSVGVNSYVYKLTISGTTVSVGALSPVLAGNVSRIYATGLSTGRVYMQYINSSNTIHSAIGVSLNGDGSFTFGQAVEIANYGVTVNHCSAMAMSEVDVLYFSSKPNTAGYTNIGYATCS